ncbi:hypothetical protein HW537_07725 [Asaia siamensis]
MTQFLRASAWLVCAVFALIGLAKPYFPAHVGFFVYPDHHWAFGLIRDTQGSSEILGVFVTPIALSVAALLLLTLDRDRACS